MSEALQRLPLRRRPRGQPDTREAILCCAEQLLQARGFNGFSYQHVASQLGIRPAAIHYHFPSKDDLGFALVQRYREQFQTWARGHESVVDPWQRLQAYFGIYVKHLETQDCRLCPGGVLGTEYATLPDAVRDEARLLVNEIYAWLVRTLEAGRQARCLNFEGDAYDKAVQIAAALQGGLQIARITGPRRFRQLLAQLALELTGQAPLQGSLP